MCLDSGRGHGVGSSDLKSKILNSNQSTIQVEVAKWLHKAFEGRYSVSTFHLNHVCSSNSTSMLCTNLNQNLMNHWIHMAMAMC